MSSCYPLHIAATVNWQFMLNLGSVRCYFYSAADSFDCSRGLLCGVDLQPLWFFCHGRQSGWRDWAPGSEREKADAVRKLIVVFILPFHAQSAPTRSLRVTLPASVRPCSRNGRCSTSVAPATRAATGQCLMSSTGPGPTQSTTVRGMYMYMTSPFITDPCIKRV